MSKEDHKKKVEKSRIVPNKYKEQYKQDFEELKEESEKSKAELNKAIKLLTKKQIRKLKAFLLIA